MVAGNTSSGQQKTNADCADVGALMLGSLLTKWMIFSSKLDMKNDDLVAGYIARTEPVQWVSWLDQMPDTQTRSKLHAILFDSRGILRDLAKPAIRRKVLDCAKRNASLKKLVISEAKAVIEETVSKVTGLKSRPDG